MDMLRLLFMMLALSPLAVATAAVVNYDEAGDGDLGTFFYGDQPLLAFDIGANTVSGNTGWDGFTSGDRDEFEFIISAGTQVTSISYAFSNVVAEPNITSLGVTIENPVSSGDLDVYVLDDFYTVTSPVALFTSSLPIGQGTYDWVNKYHFYGGDGDTGGFWDYTITFNVETSAVPIPAAFWLFGSGLLGLVGVARRKKS